MKQLQMWLRMATLVLVSIGVLMVLTRCSTSASRKTASCSSEQGCEDEEQQKERARKVLDRQMSRDGGHEHR